LIHTGPTVSGIEAVKGPPPLSSARHWPEWIAVVVGLFALATLAVLRRRGASGAARERRVLAAFLAGMPFVYVTSFLVSREGPLGDWLAIELVGLVVFGTLAWLGLRRSPWFLVAGIATHGLLWDLWHVDRTTFISNAYAVACLIVDVGLAAYAATRVAHLRHPT
jgi:hypothetical protein